MNQDFSLFEQRLIEVGYDSAVIEQILEVARNSIYPKKYGLVWEEKEEKIKENLKLQIPYLEELKEREVKLSDVNSPQHLLIEGDNYETLKLLQATHRGKISIIAIDPPYNTGKEFIYNDKLVDKEDGYRHSKWLSFMSKRLTLAKELLSDDGVIFINIDEHEFAQLKLLCDEIFGESNFVENFIWIKNSTKNNSKTTSTNHEYVLCYCKNIELVKNSDIFRVEKEGLDLVSFLRDDFIKNEKHLFKEPHLELEKRLRKLYKENPYLKGISMYKNVDKERLSFFRTSDISAPGGNGGTYDVIHPVTGKPCKLPSGGYRYKRETMEEMIKNNQILFGKDEKTVIQSKRYLDTVQAEVARSVFTNNDDGKKELAQIFGQSPFSYPKPVSEVKHFLKMIPNKNAIVLDFFAGSGTTGHAVLELNQEDGGHRQFILCTNNENNICEEVTYERLKRVINGYITPKGKEVEGLPANLKYLKVGMAEKETYTDEDLSRLYMPHVLPLLQLKHNAFTLVSETKHGWVFEGAGFRFGLADQLATKRDFDRLKEQLETYEGEKILYLFSTDIKTYPKYKQLVSLDEIIRPIPREMLELLKGE